MRQRRSADRQRTDSTREESTVTTGAPTGFPAGFPIPDGAELQSATDGKFYVYDVPMTPAALEEHFADYLPGWTLVPADTGSVDIGFKGRFDGGKVTAVGSQTPARTVLQVTVLAR